MDTGAAGRGGHDHVIVLLASAPSVDGPSTADAPKECLSVLGGSTDASGDEDADDCERARDQRLATVAVVAPISVGLFFTSLRRHVKDPDHYATETEPSR